MPIILKELSAKGKSIKTDPKDGSNTHYPKKKEARNDLDA